MKPAKSTGKRTSRQPPGAGEQRMLTAVVPCYNECEGLAEFHHRLRTAMASVKYVPEIIYINDGSTDATLAVLHEISKVDRHVVVIDLSRNHGHQLAVSAGMHYARGERVLIIDADLQDPPELLPHMLALMDGGADVVYGRRRVRAGESYFKRASAVVFYRLVNRISGAGIPNDAGDFRLINRRILEIVNAMPEQHRFLRGMVATVGFNQVPIEYDRDRRFAGATKYPFRKMVALAIDGITGFAIAPLRMFFYLSGLAAIMALGLALWTVYSYFVYDSTAGLVEYHGDSSLFLVDPDVWHCPDRRICRAYFHAGKVAPVVPGEVDFHPGRRTNGCGRITGIEKWRQVTAMTTDFLTGSTGAQSGRRGGCCRWLRRAWHRAA